MIYVGIDVAKDKHDCCILSMQGEALDPSFTIDNNRPGFQQLYERIRRFATDPDQIKVGLEATGHYSCNLLAFLLEKELPTVLINPLHTNFYRRSITLRLTKTDKVDAQTIAAMLSADPTLKRYTPAQRRYEDLKSLTRYRFDKVKERAKLRQSVSRLVTILFPELEKKVTSLHTASVYALLVEFPSAAAISAAHLTRLTNLLASASKGRYDRSNALDIREAARGSIGSDLPAKSLELRHTIILIQELDKEIDEVEAQIRRIMDAIASPILTIPGINYRMGAMIVAEIGDFSRFDSPDKILAYAGLSPSIYQSGQLQNSRARMEKRGSRYLRYALFNATKYVCQWDPVFRDYLNKKRAEGKHYNVAISHAAKKLVRVIYALEKSRTPYEKQRDR